MRTVSLASILVVVLFSAEFALAQPRRRPGPTTPAESSEPLPVSIVLKDGQTLKGKFVSATTKKLTLIVGSSPQEMNMSEIASLVFSETTTSTAATANTQSTAAARDAIAALRKLDSAPSVGVHVVNMERA